MLLPIDGPSLFTSLTVGTTAVELKVGGSVLDERKGVALQSQGNPVYLGFDNTVTTSTGIKLFKQQIFIFEAGPNMPVWVISGSAGTDVRIWELG